MGKFTIVDDATVEEADLGVNFFLAEDSLGKSRAQSCTELLLELNPEVQGDWFPKNQVHGAAHLHSHGAIPGMLLTEPRDRSLWIWTRCSRRHALSQ